MKAINSTIIWGKLVLPLFVGVVAMFNMSARAETVTVFGANSLARDCYTSSITAANTGFSSHTDLEVCNKAIFHGDLGNKDRVATFVNRGIIKVALQDYVGGVKDYETALNIDPNAAEAYLNRGNLWFIAQKFNEAIGDYEKALELGVRQEQVALLNTGMAYENLSQNEKAKDYYELALEKFPEWSTALEKIERVNKKLAGLSPSEAPIQE